jgi:2,3-bisphosphoglycerate-dependent phosphoglycerate mutase
MTTLYLVRHGETIWNANRRFQGHRDISLNETGRAQAEIVARAIAPCHLDAIITSDLARAYETADIVAGKG